MDRLGHLILTVLMACLASAWLASSAHAAQAAPSRIGLVIANYKYANPKDNLPGAHRDGDAIRDALLDKRLGFTVKYVENGSRAQIEAAIRAFQLSLREAGPSGIGLIYYVGHGAADAAGTDNYLLPVEVKDVASAMPETQGVGVRAITEQLALLDTRQAIMVVLDACRTPGVSGPTGRMLPPDEQKPGFLVALSTSKGNTASENSPYAEILAKRLLTDGLTVDQVFQRVRQEVAKETNQRQVPTEQSRILDTVCLLSCNVPSAAGPYSQNPQLLASARNTADLAVQRLVPLSAQTSCSSGWNEIAALKASAAKQAETGHPDAAGATYVAVTEKAERVFEYLTTLNMLESAQKTYKELDRKHLEQWQERVRKEYDRLTEKLKSAKSDLTQKESMHRTKKDRATADALEKDARSLAEREQFQEASDKLIDAINDLYASTREMGYAPRPLEHPARRGPLVSTSAGFVDKQRQQLAPMCQ